MKNTKTIEYLKSLPENPNVRIKFGNYIGKFMWFLNDNILEFIPDGNITLISVNKIFWNDIELVD